MQDHKGLALFIMDILYQTTTSLQTVKMKHNHSIASIRTNAEHYSVPAPHVLRHQP
jgi:hypothetical protein